MRPVQIRTSPHFSPLGTLSVSHPPAGRPPQTSTVGVPLCSGGSSGWSSEGCRLAFRPAWAGWPSAHLPGAVFIYQLTATVLLLQGSLLNKLPGCPKRGHPWSEGHTGFLASTPSGYTGPRPQSTPAALPPGQAASETCAPPGWFTPSCTLSLSIELPVQGLGGDTARIHTHRARHWWKRGQWDRGDLKGAKPFGESF